MMCQGSEVIFEFDCCRLSSFFNNNRYVETKGPTECRDAVNNMFVNGPIGSMTYKESDRGNATDHTSPPSVASSSNSTNTSSNLSLHELIVLGFMPARDDFEVEFENDSETLVSSIPAASGNSRVESDDEEVCMSNLISFPYIFVVA